MPIPLKNLQILIPNSGPGGYGPLVNPLKVSALHSPLTSAPKL